MSLLFLYLAMPLWAQEYSHRVWRTEDGLSQNTVSSYATRTSPVLHGKWILENVLNAPPPPPPPAFQMDLTRVSTMVMGRKGSVRTYGEIGNRHLYENLPILRGISGTLFSCLRIQGKQLYKELPDEHY